MKLALSIAFACTSLLVCAQQVNPLPKPQSQSKYGSPKNFDNSTKKDILKQGYTTPVTTESSVPYYPSTVVYHQVGNELVATTLRFEDYHALQVKHQEILELNQQLQAPQLSTSDKNSLLQQREALQQNYNILLNQSIANAE